MIPLIIALLALGAIAALADLFFARRNRRRTPSPAAPEPPAPPRPEGCCGQHEVCEKESLLAAVSRDIEYYEDEELDAFRGRPSDRYTDAETEQFREVLYTMREDEVAGWVRSLQLRGVALPDDLKDEVLLIVGERRSAASAQS